MLSSTGANLCLPWPRTTGLFPVRTLELFEIEVCGRNGYRSLCDRTDIATVGTTLAPLQPSSSPNAAGPSERQASYGSIWTVGGVAPSGNAVNDGRGHLVQTGTTARLFRTTFSTAKPKPNEELEKHQARLASALELDQTQRVFEFDIKARSTNRQKRGRAFSFTPRKTFWDGAQWVNEGPIPGECRRLQAAGKEY
jgi:meiosis-specific APC/C activator protein AMA1